MSKCEICGKDGFHKLSCTNNKERQKRLLIELMQADEKDGLYNKAIPTLEGDEAEEFIRKADENVKKFINKAKEPENSDRSYPAKNIKNGNVNIKCNHCGGCGYHKMSCATQSVNVFLNPDSRIAKRILRHTKSATQKVKRNKDVEP